LNRARGFQLLRGADVEQAGLFSCLSPESRIPKKYPLRPVREMVKTALAELTGKSEAIYAVAGRSIDSAIEAAAEFLFDPP
jgi:hypothetical protein